MDRSGVVVRFVIRRPHWVAVDPAAPMSADPPMTPDIRSTSVAPIGAMIQRPAMLRSQAAEATTLGPTDAQARTSRVAPRGSESAIRDTRPQRQWLDATHPGRSRRSGDVVHLSPGVVIPGTRYRLLRWLGEGGMGVVYEAEHIDIQHRVAVKILRLEVCDQPEALQLFRDEARAAARIGSPYIVEILDFAELPDGRLLYTMELLGGRPLARELAERPLPPGRAIGILRQVCKGIASAHAAHIVHRDIKPDNIFLDNRQSRRDVVKILDFGISIFMAGETVTDDCILGTPLYLAPEIIAGKPFDPRVDIYAFGCTAFEMLTGRPPYDGTVKELLLAHLHAPLPASAALCGEHGVPEALAAVVLRCMAKRPDDRYTDMHDLEAALCEAQITAKLETAWDDLLLPDVDGDRRDRLLRGMPDPALMGIVQPRSRRRSYLAAAVVGGLLLTAAGLLLPPRGAVVAAAVDPQMIRLEATARAAASRVAFVYPRVDEPAAPTWYDAIRELEAITGPRARAASELAQRLRREFAGTLGAFGDRLWLRTGGREFAVDAYAQALIFDPDVEPAASRADLTPGQLARLTEKAASHGFTATELIAIEPLVALVDAEADADFTVDTVALRDVRERVSRRIRGRDSALVTAAVAPVTEPTPPPAESPVELSAAPFVEAGPTSLDPRVDEPVRDPRAARKLLEQARTAVRGGDRKAAEGLFERALAQDSRNVDALAGLTDLHFHRGAYARALSFGLRACNLAPDDAALHLLVGDAAFKAFRVDAARTAYRRAQQLGHREAAGRLAKLDAKFAD